MNNTINMPGKCVGDDSYANGWNKCREAYLPLLVGRDARIAELEARIVWLECEAQVSAAPVSEAKAQGVGSPIRFWFIGDEGQKKGATFCRKSSRDGSLAFFETEEDATRAAKRNAGTAVYSVDYYKSAQVVMPAEFDRAFITGESCDGVYRVVIKSETLKEMQAVHGWLARLNAATVQQVSVPDGLELIKRMQVCLSLDDTEWGLSAPEKYKLLGDIKSYVLAAPAAPAADAGLVEALEKIAAYAPCSGIKDPGLTKMHMGILARDAIAANRANGVV